MEHWTDITPQQAKQRFPKGALGHPIVLPRNEEGNDCPWPWEPEQLSGAPLGQYHCPYCGAMALAGIPHPDYTVLALEEATEALANAERLCREAKFDMFPQRDYLRAKVAKLKRGTDAS